MRRIAIVTAESRSGATGVIDYSFNLRLALQQHSNVASDLFIRTDAGKWAIHNDPSENENDSCDNDLHFSELIDDLSSYDAVIIQYVPFMYHRWGFAPWLPWRLFRLRRLTDKARLVLMVHEPYVPIIDWRSAIMGSWQRLQLKAIQMQVSLVLISVEGWRSSLLSKWPAKQVHHLPVGSNLPASRRDKDWVRAKLQIDAAALVIATFTSANPGQFTDYITVTVNAIASRTPVVLLVLGAGAPYPRGLSPETTVLQPGKLGALELSDWLNSADLFLSPFSDGVSTRRTTFVAALQHGIPIVGTSGRLTDAVLRAENHIAFVLVPVGSPQGFAEAAVRLINNTDQMHQMGASARALYEERFSWEVLSRQLLMLLS